MNQYPFWLKNQADNASASAYHAQREAENAKRTVQESEERHSKCMKKLSDITSEISKYQTAKSKDELKSILENIKKIIVRE